LVNHYVGLAKIFQGRISRKGGHLMPTKKKATKKAAKKKKK